ncbi:FG-GAP repeat domain-containing protein [Kocuria sp. M4R2S49]|uniref:FG-GAP repeat domain-containing protein n=2 Tax=Kocuria rhizosphaericola TaxID=3376284 RepID=UPI0037A91599
MKHSPTSRLLTGATTVALAAGGVALTGTAAQAAAQPYFTYTNGWRVDLHVRELADVNGDGRQDVVGFGYRGTYVALGRANGTFGAPQLRLGSFGYDQGWRVDEHPRLLGDVNGDGRDDIVAFGNAGTYVSYGQADGSFTAPALKLGSFGSDQGWTVADHLRVLGDVNGDGRDDIVAFGNAGTYVSYGQAGNTFTAPALKLGSFGSDQGWNEDRYPRELADINGDGLDDIVGFGYAGTWVSYGRTDNTFTAPALKLQNFGAAQGWTVDQHPREVGDVNGDGRDDIVGFGYGGTWVSYGQANGNLSAATRKVQNFGVAQGWTVGQHPRELADMNGDGIEDIVGFGYGGTWVSYGRANSTFSAPALEVANFGLAQGWTEDRFPRELGDVNGDGRDDVVGFGYSSTYIELF